jgi:hypothetical protein
MTYIGLTTFIILSLLLFQCHLFKILFKVTRSEIRTMMPCVIPLQAFTPSEPVIAFC